MFPKYTNKGLESALEILLSTVPKYTISNAIEGKNNNHIVSKNMIDDITAARTLKPTRSVDLEKIFLKLVLMK